MRRLLVRKVWRSCEKMSERIGHFLYSRALVFSGALGSYRPTHGAVLGTAEVQQAEYMVREHVMRVTGRFLHRFQQATETVSDAERLDLCDRSLPSDSVAR